MFHISSKKGLWKSCCRPQVRFVVLWEDFLWKEQIVSRRQAAELVQDRNCVTTKHNCTKLHLTCYTRVLRWWHTPLNQESRSCMICFYFKMFIVFNTENQYAIQKIFMVSQAVYSRTMHNIDYNISALLIWDNLLLLFYIYCCFMTLKILIEQIHHQLENVFDPLRFVSLNQLF